MARCDEMLASTLTLLGKFLTAENAKRARRMYPLFVVTKFDRASPEALRRLRAPAGSPEGWSPQQRAEVGKAILQNYLPKTGKFLLSKGKAAVIHDPPMWFFSGLRTEERAGETRIARRERPPMGGWEPEYPFDEYHSLLLRMSEIVHRLPEEAEA